MTAARPEGGGLTAKIAGSYPLADTYHSAALEADMVGLTERVSQLVPDATGLSLEGSPTTAVVGRVEWVERNAASLSHMLEPARRQLEERMNEQAGGTGVASMAGKVMQAEATAVLSVLARRVLGQYELVLPTGGDGDVVIYVGPNILQLERVHQFTPSEFRFWVALHEMTHRAQFQGVPWLRDYFMGLVTELIEASRPEPGRLNMVIEELAQRRENGAPIIDERGIFGLFATPAQRAVIEDVQALMSLLEGHGHVVMDRLGAEHLRSQARMSRVLKLRRRDRRTAAFYRITGLEMKMKQYQLGERFIRIVEEEAGWDTTLLAFRGASSLPSLKEIEEPTLWLQRVA